MKLMKKFKSGLIGLGLVIPVASVAGVVTSCGKKETPPPAKPTFGDFTKAAKAETAVNIVAQTKPKDWVNIPDSDLNPGNFKVVDQTVVISIIWTLKSQIATFVATYVADTDYDISDWKCSDGPKTIPNFKDFKANAEKGGPEGVFHSIWKINPPGINIDLKNIETASFSIDDNANDFSDNGKDTVSLELLLEASEKMPFNITKTINLSIHFDNNNYDPKNWTAPDYTFKDFTTDANSSVTSPKASDSWRTWAAGEKLSWDLSDCKFNPVVAGKNVLTTEIYNKTTLQSVTATLGFHQKNNKVWIYGEQMGNLTNTTAAWSFSNPITKGWDTPAKALILKASNDVSTSKNNFLTAMSPHISQSKFPHLYGFLATNKTDPEDWSQIKFTITDLKFVPAPIPAVDHNRFGEETFKIVFYKIKDAKNETPLTSGGLFYMDRASATSLPTNYKNCSCLTDVDIIHSLCT